MMKDYNFKPGWKASVLLAVSLLLFVRLGFWQLQRAAEKLALQESRDLRARSAPLRLDGRSGGELDALRFRPVVLSGHYDAEHQFLLDNQTQGQRPGYHVLTPLRLDGGAAVLVNRGWIPAGSTRSELPDLAIARPEVDVAGVVEKFPAVGLKISGTEIPAPGWPAVVQSPEPGPLANRLGYPILPYQVLLDPAADQGYLRAWREVRLDPNKNRGYAVQWFALAALASVLYLRHGLKASRKPVDPDHYGS